jgi:alkanesulfonate monooxygenase SsuD/methylene tetrahydromethanopterin reductase-like flavin-dependent oxidoreductase (luciferase family)
MTAPWPAPRLGICLSEFPQDPNGRWRNVAEVVGRIEDSGADGLWLADHILWHSKAIDAQSSLPALASHAQRLTIGSCVLQLPLRDPITVAKTMVNTQMMAPGRVVCGVGLGENPEEYERLGKSLHSRGKVIEESISEIRRVWGQHGGTRWMNPEPVDIPIWVGGRHEAARSRAARMGDGWLPYLCSPRWFGRHLSLLEEELESLGRDTSKVTKGVVTFVDIPSIESAQQGFEKMEHWFGFDPTPLMGFLLRGTAAEVADQLAEHVAAGADEVLVVIANDRPLDVLDALVPAFTAATA